MPPLVLPVVDDELDEAGALVDVLAFGLADGDDVLCWGLDEDFTEVVDTGLPVGAEFGHLGLGVAWALFLPAPLELGLGLGDVEGVVVGVPLGLTLGLGLGLTLGLGLVLALADALGLELAMLPLLALPLADVAGVPVLLLAGLLVVAVVAACVDDDGQAVVVGPPVTAGLPACEACGVGAGVLPCPSSDPVALEELWPVKAALMSVPNCDIAWRAGGTAARTTPTANTATPTAKAGRSIASRQSLGRRGSRCGPRRCGPRRAPPRSAARPRAWSPSRAMRQSRSARERRRQISPAATPEMASQIPRIQLGRLAWAGRDRILSRIRSRPSEPGST